MRIGFIKLGLKTYFGKNGTGQGSNHELVDTFHIFEERGHICYMLSNNDIDNMYKTNDLDWIFVFNGFAPSTWETNMNMLKGSLESLKFLRDNKDIPYAYFWTDPRYDISKNPIFKEIPPKVILSQEPKHYGHLDKLIMYKKDAPFRFEKNKLISILMNNTGERTRKKAVMDAINWLKHSNRQCEIIGDWKKDKDIQGSPLDENGIIDYLSTVKYSYNVGKEETWVSQKYWEMILSDVICFYSNYDKNNILLGKDEFRRVVDGIELTQKIETLEKNGDIYYSLILFQRSQLKSDYYTGEFVYNKIMEKIKC